MGSCAIMFPDVIQLPLVYYDLYYVHFVTCKNCVQVEIQVESRHSNSNGVNWTCLVFLVIWYTRGVAVPQVVILKPTCSYPGAVREDP